jgi:hypothetical protein
VSFMKEDVENKGSREEKRKFFSDIVCFFKK